MKKVCGLFLAAALITSILGGCTQYKDGKPVEKKAEQTAAKPQEEKKKEEPKKELTLDEKIKQGVNKKLDKKTNMKKNRIVELEVNDNLGTEDEGDKIILLTLAGDENLSSKMTIKGMLMDSNKAFQEVFKNNEASEVTVFWQFPLVDTYGKSKVENVIKIALKRETFEKIDWKAFDYNNYKKIADQYWMHPVLKNEME